MTRYEYVYIAITLILDDIIHQYNLLPLVRNWFIYLDICKGVYEFPQAGRLENNLLTKKLAPKWYSQFTHTPGLWRHKFLPIFFSLVVDNSSVNYVVKEHSNHLILAIR